MCIGAVHIVVIYTLSYVVKGTSVSRAKAENESDHL